MENGITAEWKYDDKNENNFKELQDIVDSNNLYNDNGFKKEEDAKLFIEHILSNNPIPKVLEASKKTQKENAPLLYNLAEIQNECSKKFKISPDQTLEVIQLLYEKKLVTYPRTDARVLSTAVAKEISKNLNGIAKWGKDEEIKNIINNMITNKYSTDIVKSKYVNDSKITDHYALIPTGQGFENYESLQDLHKNIYKLITKRFLSIFFPPAEYTKLSITIDIGGQKFYANSKVCTKLGYLEVVREDKNSQNKNDADLKQSDEEENNTMKDVSASLAKIKKGQSLTLGEIITKEGETSPPSRYTSGSIILAMENAGKLIEDERLREQIKGSGIGTSATRAEIIKKLNRIGYIDINSKTQVLTPSQKGEQVYRAVSWSIPDMLNPDLTASWEKGLDMVARKEIKPDEFMTKLEAYINVKTAKLKR